MTIIPLYLYERLGSHADSNFPYVESLLMKLLADPSVQRLITMHNYSGLLLVRHLFFLYFNQPAMHGLPLILSPGILL